MLHKYEGFIEMRPNVEVPTNLGKFVTPYSPRRVYILIGQW
jgi:hypothetical protein